MQTLFLSLSNISAKYNQNWSLQFWAIPFQSWCIFETVCAPKTSCYTTTLSNMSATTMSNILTNQKDAFCRLSEYITRYSQTPDMTTTHIIYYNW